MGQINVRAWKAKHESGTKFYHVVRLQRPNGKGVTIAHWGVLPADLGMYNFVSGQRAIEEDPHGATRIRKIREKGKSYNVDVIEEDRLLEDGRSLHDWLAKAFGDRADRIKIATYFADNPDDYVFTPATSAPKEADEPDHLKHSEWGTW